MAENEQEEQNNSPAEANESLEKPKKKRKLALLLGIGGIGLAAAGGGGFFVMKTLSGGQPEMENGALPSDAHGETKEENAETAQTADKNDQSKPTKDISEPQNTSDSGSAAETSSEEQADASNSGSTLSLSAKNISDENSFGETFEIPKMELNLGNPLENRFLRFGVSLEYHGGEDQAQELEKRLPQMRDIIISLIGRKTRMELLTPEGKENLRKQLKNTLNEVFEQPITNVYFTSFLVE